LFALFHYLILKDKIVTNADSKLGCFAVSTAYLSGYYVNLSRTTDTLKS